MIKRLLLGLCIATTASAHIPKFPLEDQLARLYLDVDIQAHRIYIQKLEEQYILWVNSVQEDFESKEDAIYVKRLNDMFAEVWISYHFGN